MDASALSEFYIAGERSVYFTSLNRGKESIALDLADEQDRAVFDQLLGISDVLVENFRPGAMEKLGYGWDAIHERFPGLISAAASGFGDSGPYRRRPAYDLVVQAMGGIMSLTGPAGGPPTRVGTSIGDLTAGLFTCIAINAALFHRAQSGEGQKIDVSMLDCQVAILENAIARFEASSSSDPMASASPVPQSAIPFSRRFFKRRSIPRLILGWGWKPSGKVTIDLATVRMISREIEVFPL